MAAIDFSGKRRQATDKATSATSFTVTAHDDATAIDVYATQSGTFKVHTDDTAATLPASSWVRVWDRGAGPSGSTQAITVTLGSSGDLSARQVV